VGGEAATRDLLNMVGLTPGSRVLDVGCGAGHTACLVAREFDARVDGIDLSPEMIARARQRAQDEGLADRVEFQVGDIRQMPFADGTFDVALFQSVLTPFPGDPVLAMREILRLVRPGGRVAANEGTLDEAAPAAFRALLDAHPATYHVFTPASLRALFESAGLQVTALEAVELPGAPVVRYQLGCRRLLSFMVRSYPKLAMRLLTDPALRRAHHLDDQVTKEGRKYMGYALIVGQKPAE